MDAIIPKASIWKCPMKILTRCPNFRVIISFVSMTISCVFIKCVLSILDKSVDDLSQPPPMRPESLLGPPPNAHAFGSPPDKRQNPFRSGAQDVPHPLQQPQMLMPPNLPMPRGAPRPLLDIPTGGFNNARPFLGHNPLMADLIDSPVNQPPSNPFMLNAARGLGPPPHLNSPQMNFRNNNNSPNNNINNNSPSIRGNSPYFRNPKGPMRGSGGFRPNFRGGGGNRNW